jgi:hypothetical protein
VPLHLTVATALDGCCCTRFQRVLRGPVRGNSDQDETATVVPEADDLQEGVKSARVSAKVSPVAPSHPHDGHGDRPRRLALHVEAQLPAVDRLQHPDAKCRAL